MFRSMAKGTVAAGLCFALWAAPSNASLIGDEVEGVLNFGGFGETNFFDPANGFVPMGAGPQPIATVGTGTEFMYEDLFSAVDVDIDGDTITIEQANVPDNAGGPFNSWDIWLNDLDWVDRPGTLVDVSLVSDSFDPGLTWDWTGDSIHFSYAGGAEEPQSFFAEFEITAEHRVIPEPATVMLLGMGVAGLAYRQRRKHN